MTNEITQTKGNYLTDLQKLDGATLRDFVDPNHQASTQELQMLMAIVKNRNLNPFTKEVYFIKYGNNPAQIVVSKDAFLKRAEQNPNYDGFKSGIVYEDEKGELKNKEGIILPRGGKLIGGWCEVYRKDRTRPGQMIEKVAIVAAIRDTFSEDVGGLYSTDEMEQAQPIDVTPQESREDVVARKMAQIEQFNREQETSYVEPEMETEAPHEPIQGELLDDNELEF